ncbi:HD domain-containing phosphohydrolase [Desulfoplanes formicivorans]|uniref:Two-component response regulator n=1 Tax=Desulfoplanes formicivorans TaxID=1592317 RepID=A0A194AHX8_9BACT|nr:HD domain-containing phosphohydrolase [Desulfoplanes formicivorans]GAU08374.1 two-component response regulator [Desulfoplanes formicivorans]
MSANQSFDPEALTGRILVVDDEPMNRQLMKELLTSFGHEVVCADGALQALALLDDSCDLVLLDVVMPGMDGLSLAREIRKRSDVGDIPLVMVTSLTSRQCRLEAVEAGANDFIAKPIDVMELRIRVRSMLRMKQAQDGVKQYQAHLEDMVRIKTRALTYTVENLTLARRSMCQAHRETIRCLAVAAEYRDANVAGHIMRMSKYAALIAENLGLSDEDVTLILEASPMHDIGKIGIADSILLKPGKLTPGEWNAMKEHSLIGANILDSASSTLIQTGSLIAMTHHEKWDGSGYPRGISGRHIPLFGRICAVADVFDALTTARPYKKTLPMEEALSIMNMVRGKHFDPKVFDAFVMKPEKVARIYRQHHSPAQRTVH